MVGSSFQLMLNSTNRDEAGSMRPSERISKYDRARFRVDMNKTTIKLQICFILVQNYEYLYLFDCVIFYRTYFLAMTKMGPPKIPERQILTKDDLEKFQTSSALQQYFDLITRLNEAIKNRKLGADDFEVSESVEKVFSVLGQLEQLISEFPPQDVGLSRFGNPSFRSWHKKMSDELPTLLHSIVKEDYIGEVGTYLSCSFGDSSRIDYGTGHEANFMCFILCLFKLDVFTEQDDCAVGLKLFWRYILLMRKLQGVYWLEPAGSHGVWGLDDYQFLPFLFGASQLCGIIYLQ